MTVVLCGVGADTGNVRPVPRVDADGRFEYVPIPEKGATTESATYGSMDRHHGPGRLADVVDAVRPNSDGDWLTSPDAVAAQPVHRDPNLEALTYGEHRPPYVAKLAGLDAGDVVAFYGGFRGPDTDLKHRHLFGYLTVADDPVVLEPDASATEKEAVFDAHPENAHAKRYAGHGDCYYHDPEFVERPHDVVVVPGREPGGRLERAVKLSDERVGPNYYMADEVAAALDPARNGKHGPHLGGFKPAVVCDVGADAFRSWVQQRPSTVA